MQRDKDYVDQHVKKKKIKKWKPQRVSHQKCTAVGDSLMITSPRRRNLKGFIIRLQHPTIHAGKRKYTVKVLHISPQTTPDPSPCHPLLTGRFASWHVPSLLHDLLSHRLTYLLANVALKRAENTKRKNKKKNQALGGAAKLYDSQRTCQSNERTEPWLSFNNTTSNNFCHRSLFLQSSSTLKPVSDIGWQVPRRGVVPMRLCFYSTSERPLVKCRLQQRKLFDSLFFFFFQVVHCPDLQWWGFQKQFSPSFC